MGTQRTLDILGGYISLLEDCGDTQGAAAVRSIASALSAAEAAQIKAAVTKVKKVWAKSPEMQGSPIGLGTRLVSLQNLLVRAGAKTASADIKLLAELLDGRAMVSAEEFESLFRRAIEAPTPVKQKRASGKRIPLSTVEVLRLADRLTAATTNQAAFEMELSAIQAIPKLSVPELRAIAEQYLGYEPPKGKAGTLKKLRTRQMQDAIEAGRQSRIQHLPA